MKLIVNGRDFTSLCVGLTLEDNIYAASAVLTARIVFENHNGYLPPLFAFCGDDVVLEDKGQVFRGCVSEVEVIGKEGVFEITAYDKGHLLAKNDVYGIFSSNCVENARKALRQAGLAAGELPDKRCRSFVSYGGMTAKAVIDESYGEGYFTEYEGDRLNVCKVGERSVGLSPSMMFDIRSVESVDDMVNMVSLTNSKHRVIYNTESSEDINKYGKYHKYRQISRNESGAQVARSMLKGVHKSASVIMGGEFALKKGRSVVFDLERYGLVGSYIIESVRHEITDGVHTTGIGVRHGSIL